MNSFEEPKQKEKEENFWENITSGSNESSWYANIEEPIKSSKLTYNIPSSSSGEPVDVAIIGGGIAGLTTCLLAFKIR